MSTPPLTSPASGKIRWPEKIGYASGDTACCLFWAVVSSYLNIFYTDVYGLAPAALGWLLLITRIWDAAFDPIMGMIADRTQTRWGKFRPWILWGIVPFVVAEIALFYTPNLDESGKLIYAYVTYSLMMFIYSVLNVPYGALLGVITHDSNERTSLASFRFIGAFAGNFIVQGSLLYLVAVLGRGDDRLGYTLAVSVLACLSGVLFFYLFSSTKERVRPPVERNSIRSDLSDLVHNGPWVMLFLIGAATLVYVTLRQVVTVYYFSYYVGDKGLTAAFLLVGTVFSIIGAILAPWFVSLIGCKKRSFMVLTAVAVLANAISYFAGPKDIVLIFAMHILGSIPMAAIFPLMGSMFADTADYGEWRFGRRATGLVFAGSTFSQKTGGAIGAALVNVVLSWVGYVANGSQSQASLDGLRHLMSSAPACGGVIVIFMAAFYTLDARKQGSVAAELLARKTKAAN